jgi:dTDP-4-dehydrorhamnose 3,5-epimerase
MIFNQTTIPGVFEIDLDPHADERGFFARSWCQKEFEGHGLNPRMVQCNISFNTRKGTLRGMHDQAAPHAEAKVVRCTAGAIYDVVIDLRPQSATFRQWFATALSAENRRMLYVPEGCAHGFLTLADATEVFYQMSEFYHPELTRGFRWNDPAFAIAWPEKVEVISERDRTYPDFSPAGFAGAELSRK